MTSPYAALPPRAFWRSGVAERHALDMGDVYTRKFDILPGDRIATAGSCFAQHIATRLRLAGYDVLDAEAGPPVFDDETARRYGFRLFSARWGNIYTVRQMRQLVQEARGQRVPMAVWQKSGRFYDALRPGVEPDGLPSPEHVIRHRLQHLTAVRWLLSHASLFIFTMGLTECWENIADGTVYPTAPGTIAGTYDPALYRFKNLDFLDNLTDFMSLRELLRGYNSAMRFIITVSPVPLTATAGNQHVLAATTYSKSVLRAVAGHLAQSYDDIDYFPSYELIAGTQARGMFYENNQREVAATGVDIVMRSFFEQHGRAAGAPARAAPQDLHPGPDSARQKAYCDEALLEAFAK